MWKKGTETGVNEDIRRIPWNLIFLWATLMVHWGKKEHKLHSNPCILGLEFNNVGKSVNNKNYATTPLITFVCLSKTLQRFLSGRENWDRISRKYFGFFSPNHQGRKKLLCFGIKDFFASVKSVFFMNERVRKNSISSVQTLQLLLISL